MTLTDPKTSNISVIIPCLNEEADIARTILSAKNEAFEIIVVDSGSDGSAGIARRLQCKVITAPAGRASQMNAGARAASGDILLFLHGDTLLPKGYSTHIQKVFSHPKVICGAFQLHIKRSGWSIKVVEFCTNIRAKLCGVPYGDQAIFIYKSQFVAMGGYADVPFLEDVLLVKTLKKRGNLAIAGIKVSTSGRRWQKNGVLRTTLINRLIMIGFQLGISPKRLKHWYGIIKK